MLDGKITSLHDQITDLKIKLKSARNAGDHNRVEFGNIPEELQTPYNVDNPSDGLARDIQRKYNDRRRNMRRCWNRCRAYVPELMHHDMEPQRVLEMSTAHGAMLEILRHFGHHVHGNDYANMVGKLDTNERALFRDVNDTSFHRDYDDYGIPLNNDMVDWPYRNIIESIRIPMSIFDAGHTPYPFEDNQFDYLLCFQALEHYCHPKDWMIVVDEFCRITRKSIILVLNPFFDIFDGMPDDYPAAFRAFVEDMQAYRRNGFMNVSTTTYFQDNLGFKLMYTG